MAKAREDLVKEKHQLKEELGMVEMRLDGAMEQNKSLAESKASLEQSLHGTEQNLARVELHKESLEREVEELAQIKEDLTVELAAVQKEKEIQVMLFLNTRKYLELNTYLGRGRTR